MALKTHLFLVTCFTLAANVVRRRLKSVEIAQSEAAVTSSAGGELEHGEAGEPQLVYNSYYQWVPLYLFLTAVVFHIPRVFWLYFEGGLMKYFR